jgi:hypothetical protein
LTTSCKIDNNKIHTKKGVINDTLIFMMLSKPMSTKINCRGIEMY